jgi:hypothetical protein
MCLLELHTNYTTLNSKVSEECRNMIGKLLQHILENYFCGQLRPVFHAYVISVFKDAEFVANIPS